MAYVATIDELIAAVRAEAQPPQNEDEEQTMTQREFTNVEWYEIRGCRAAAIDGIPGFNPRPLLGQDVVIDGQPYRVIGVETFGIENVAGKAFSLTVKDREPKDSGA